MPGKTIPNVIMAGILLGWICGTGVPLGEAQIKSNVATVSLIAQMPTAVGVHWNSVPATPFVQDSGLRGDLVMIESTWLLGLGQNVSAECRLVAPQPGEAGILALKRIGEMPDPPIYGFLPRPLPTQVPLWKESLPERGLQVRTDGLMVVGTDTPVGKERIMLVSVTAL